MTAHTSSSIRPLSPLDALAYTPAYFLVISALARIDNPLPMPTTIRDSRGQFHIRHQPPFAGIQDESRRRLDKHNFKRYHTTMVDFPYHVNGAASAIVRRAEDLKKADRLEKIRVEEAKKRRKRELEAAEARKRQAETSGR